MTNPNFTNPIIGTNLPIASVGTRLRAAAAIAGRSNLIINPVNAALATVVNSAVAPSTTGFTNIIPLGTSGFVSSFTCNCVGGSYVLKGLTTTAVAALVVGQPLVQSAVTSTFPADIPPGAVITAIDTVQKTVTMSHPALDTDRGITVYAASSQFDVFGGVAAGYNSAYTIRGSTTTGGNQSFGGHAFQFYTDGGFASTSAATIMLETVVNGSTPDSYRVAIDDVYLTADPVAFGATHWLEITLATAGIHKVRVELPAANLLKAFWITTGYTAFRENPATIVRACGYGDSYFANGQTGVAWPMRNIPATIGNLMGWNADMCGIGSTGYSTAGGFSSPKRINTDWLQNNFDIGFIYGSSNDFSSDTSESRKTFIMDQALSCWRQIRLLKPNMPLIIFGACCRQTTALTQATNVELYLQAAFNVWADQNAWFFPMTLDPTGNWMNATNQVIYISAVDLVHPTDGIGTLYLARRMASYIESVIQGMP